MAEKNINLAQLLNSEDPPNLSRQLESHLGASILSLVNHVAGLAAERNEPAFLIGGIVRDLLLGRASLDIDFVVEGDAIALAKELQEKFGGHLDYHQRFGTAKWILEPAKLAEILAIDVRELPAHIDLITARKESYPQAGDLPTVEFEDIRADTRRRDFTINTLAIDLDPDRFGNLLNYWKGLEDIDEGVLRVLHELSFRDDATRLLRLFRFKNRFGFSIEQSTASLIESALPYIKGISGERLRHEIDLILEDGASIVTLEELSARGVLQEIHPNLSFPIQVQTLFEDWKADDLGDEWKLDQDRATWLPMCTWFMHLDGSEELIRALCDRLVLESELTKSIIQARAVLNSSEQWKNWSDSQIARALDAVPNLGLAALFLSLPDFEAEKVNQYVLSWQNLQTHSNGEDIKALGLAEGPLYAEILTQLRAAWVDDVIASEIEERELLLKLVREARH
jgi:tRNA nucleotidyltransferase (CCA-adding enzyme)